MKDIHYYALGTSILVLLSYVSLSNKIKNIPQLEDKLTKLTTSIQEVQTRRPASYIQATSNDHMFKVNLEVLEESVTVPGNSTITPPLKGYSYFCKTLDNVGYYVFSKNPTLEEGDTLNGWFSSTGLVIHNGRFNKDYSLIVPVFVEQIGLVERSLEICK